MTTLERFAKELAESFPSITEVLKQAINYTAKCAICGSTQMDDAQAQELGVCSSDCAESLEKARTSCLALKAKKIYMNKKEVADFLRDKSLACDLYVISCEMAELPEEIGEWYRNRFRILRAAADILDPLPPLPEDNHVET